jgi:hypothetical protein
MSKIAARLTRLLERETETSIFYILIKVWLQTSWALKRLGVFQQSQPSIIAGRRAQVTSACCTEPDIVLI